MTAANGISAALGAPLAMTLGFVIWDKHWTGSAFALNLYKCTLASLGFVVLSATTRNGALFASTEAGSAAGIYDSAEESDRPTPGPFSPDVFTPVAVGYLILSSTVGILVGDWTWLEALRLIGARRVIVVDSIKPFLAVLLGWAALGEALRPAAFGGMALTVAGVLWVSLEKEGGPPPGADSYDNDENEANTGGGCGENPEGTRKTFDEPANVADVERVRTNDDRDATEDPNPREAARPVDAEVLNSTAPAVGGSSVSRLEGILDADEDGRPLSSSLRDGDSEGDNNGGRRGRRRSTMTLGDRRRGYAMAVLNVGLDTYGALLTKQHGAGMTTWEINLVRFGFASVSCVALSLALNLRDRISAAPIIHGRERSGGGGANISITAIKASDEVLAAECGKGENEARPPPVSESEGWRPWYSLPDMGRHSWAKVSAGVLFVTFLCPALSNYALFEIALALALTLGSVGPLFALPLTWWLRGERPTGRSFFGALITVAGITVLSFFGIQW